MNITELFFPSGISVTRAKKDAKKLKKAQDVTLTEALNLVAQQHMSSPNITWEQAIEKLKAENQLEEIEDGNDEMDERIQFSHGLTIQELEEFLADVEKDLDSDSFISITPSNDAYIESDGNGGSVWPSPLIVSEIKAMLFCEMLNQMSLLDFEIGLLDYGLEELIGSESYDMWYDSNYPQYESSQAEEFQDTDDNDQLFASNFELKRRIEYAIQHLRTNSD